MKRIPALVVSGFLGSGKTTLVRRLLEAAQAEGARVAFISNEFGELGVDQALLGGGRESFVELAGGCVCCALNDELYDTIIRLREEVDPDRIVIETSGVAIPHDVQITFYQPPVRDWISEEAVVTVVNAEQLALGRDLDGTFTEQVESADLVLLNKLDLVTSGQIPAMVAAIEAMNPGVPVVRGDLDPRVVFGARRPGADPDPAHGHHDHDHDYTSRAVDVPAGLSAEAVEARLRPLGALRIKGFVLLDDGPAVVQGVGRRLEILPAEDPVDPALLGRVVVITRVGERGGLTRGG